MSEKITAIIPAKAMSGRLPHKNTLPFGESNMLVHKIRQLKKVDLVGEIIVSSEDDEILRMAEEEGVRAIKRPYEFSAETKPFQEFLHYIVGEATEKHVMWSCCTSPMVDSETYQKACATYLEKLNEGYDSLIAVMEYHHYLLDANMQPYTFHWGPGHRNSQDLEKLYFFTDGFQIAPKESMREWKYYFGHKPFGFEVDEKTSTDVDTLYDYLLARMQYYVDEDAMKSAGVNVKEGGEVFDYIQAKVLTDKSNDEIAGLIKNLGKERTAEILKKLEG